MTARWLVATCAALGLAASGCGGGDGTADSPPSTSSAPGTTEVIAEVTTPPATTQPVETTPTTDAPSLPPATTPTTGPDTGPQDLCAVLAADEPPDDFAAVVRPEYADVAQLIIDLSDSLDLDSSIPADIVDEFARADTSATLRDFADAVEAECGAVEAVDGIRFYAAISDMAALPTNDAYCRPLAQIVAIDTDDATTETALVAALAVAPPEHLEALTTIQTLMSTGGDSLPAGLDTMLVVEQIAGLGLYAEARCGAPDAFASMLFVGSFLGAQGDFSTEPGVGIGAAPPTADAGTANAAVPAGADLTFEVVEIDVDDEGEYLVSAVVPIGWEREDTGFGTKFDPSAGFGVFTEMSVDTGCDGMCEVTDWEARLTAPDGFITAFRSDDDLLVDRPTAGTSGVSMMKPGFADGVEGVVIRWVEGGDRYFSCDFQLSEGDVAIADAMLAACESANPGWIIGA